MGGGGLATGGSNSSLQVACLASAIAWLCLQDSNPKSQWVVGMSPQEAAYLAAMPFTVRVPSLNIIIAHAGLVPGVTIKRQRLQDLYWVSVSLADDVCSLHKP